MIPPTPTRIFCLVLRPIHLFNPCGCHGSRNGNSGFPMQGAGNGGDVRGRQIEKKWLVHCGQTLTLEDANMDDAQKIQSFLREHDAMSNRLPLKNTASCRSQAYTWRLLAIAIAPENTFSVYLRPLLVKGFERLHVCSLSGFAR
ncbi:hypothetical protein L218DRAFT_767151 [Marasmius fiardii PR-910]|nr:hypothetical protein L218DRAFT_767151 [Marasmius fiardii PR-910]